MRYFLVFACLFASACTTVERMDTPSQKLFAALSAYQVAVAAAADYAETPTANREVVVALDNVINSDEMKGAVSYARAWAACGGVADGVALSFDCSTFNFSDLTVSQYALIITSGAQKLLRRR